MTELPKLVLIGAGSAVFGLKALASIIRSERLRGLELWLVDIDESALEHHGHRLTEVANYLEIMRNEEGCEAEFLLQAIQQLQDFALSSPIK